MQRLIDELKSRTKEGIRRKRHIELLMRKKSREEELRAQEERARRIIELLPDQLRYRANKGKNTAIVMSLGDNDAKASVFYACGPEELLGELKGAAQIVAQKLIYEGLKVYAEANTNYSPEHGDVQSRGWLMAEWPIDENGEGE